MVTPATRVLLTALAAALQPRAEVLEAYLFGSKATGAARAHSDVDVAVFLADRPNSGLDDFLAFAQHVERYLSRGDT